MQKDPDDLNIIAQQISCTTSEISHTDIQNGKHGNLQLCPNAIALLFWESKLYKNKEAEIGEKNKN